MKYPLNNWYVVQTIARKEKKTREKIEKLQIEKLQTMLPLRKLWIKRRGKFSLDYKPLFPGYFFINKKLNSSDVKRISRVDGVVKILASRQRIVSVPEKEMGLIISLIREDEIIPESKIFYKNEKVMVKAGPLVNMEGRIIAVDKRKKRIKLRLPFFNTFKDVQLSFELVEKT